MNAVLAARKPDLRFLLSNPAHFIALGFGAGLAPKAPGTFGTLVAIPIAYALWVSGSQALFLAMIALAVVLGAWSAQVAGTNLGTPDHGAIVIDEVAAFLIVLWFAGPRPLDVVVAFALFRFFDIVKPPPIRWVDARWKNGAGAMADDLVAAAFAVVVFVLVKRTLGA